MSAVALLTVSLPSALRTARAAALSCIASQMPPAMPQPINAWPARMERGCGSPAERDPLPGLGAVAETEHLRSGHRYAHRAFQFPRGQRREEHVILRPQPRAECAADKRRQDAQLVFREPEHTTQVTMDVLHALRL